MYQLIIIVSIFLLGTSFIKESKYRNSEIIRVEANQPKELGKVSWLRDLKEASRIAAQTSKPIFILFQEVPGCATCRNYGDQVLSHPLIVEAIETHFVPLAVFNNKGGKDKEVLDFFKEPSWNNPVVRIVNQNKKDLTRRVSGNYTALGLTHAMIEVLQNKNVEVPEYLKLLQTELLTQKKGTTTTYLSMYCFWTGEKNLATIEGVVETQAGFMNGREVVKVAFDPAILPFEKLVKTAKTKSFASHVFSDNLTQQLMAERVMGSEYVSEKSTFKMDRETKYYLYKSSYKYVPMTKLQATKANSLIGKGHSPNTVLSPRQLELVKHIQNNPGKKWKSAINADIVAAWDVAQGLK